MRKLVLATVLASMFGIASAEGTYASLTYDQKDKQASDQVNHVYGLNVGQKFGNGWSAEVRMEDEIVAVGDGTQKQESLAQVKLNKDFSFGMVTPYVAGAIGQKSKSTSDFPFWVAEVGAKVNLGDSLTARYGFRERQAFDTGNSYDTREHTIALGYNLTKQDAISLAYKQERGTSDYNTTGVYYTRGF
jgi:hypothetical protein